MAEGVTSAKSRGRKKLSTFANNMVETQQRRQVNPDVREKCQVMQFLVSPCQEF